MSSIVNKNGENIIINTVNNINQHKFIKLVPIYLVSFENPILNKEVEFVVTKLDDTNQYCIKIVGINKEFLFKNKSLKKEKEKLKLNNSELDYKEMLKSVDKELYEEIMVPWQRVISIKNLMFKSK